jgi:hypothetical protein
LNIHKNHFLIKSLTIFLKYLNMLLQGGKIMKKIMPLWLALLATFGLLSGCGGSSSSGNTDLSDPDIVNGNDTYPITSGVWILETRVPQDDGSHRIKMVMTSHDTRNGWLHQDCGSVLFSTKLPQPLTPRISTYSSICSIPSVAVVGDYDYKISCGLSDWELHLRKVSDSPVFEGSITVLIDGRTEMSVDNACAEISFVETQTGEIKDIWVRFHEAAEQIQTSGDRLMTFVFGVSPQPGNHEAGHFASNSDLRISQSQTFLEEVLGQDSINSGILTITETDRFFFNGTFDLSTALNTQITGSIQFPFLR